MMLLEDCCDILDSMRVPITAKDRKKGTYPYYGANGVQDYVADYIFDDELVLLAEDGGNFGSEKKPIAYKVSGKCWVNNHAHVLKSKAGIDVDYLCYSLMFYKVDGMVNGATRMKLTQAAMRKMLIPKREIKEQQEITGMLNKIQLLLKLKRKQIEKYDELIKSRFAEMFDNNDDWDMVNIEDICSDMRTGPFGSALHHDEFVDNGIFVLGIDNAVENKFSYNKMRYITKEKYQKLKRYTVKPLDVIITIMGTVGRSAVIPKDIPLAINTKHLACLTLKDELADPYFLANAFQIHPEIIAQMHMNSKGAIMDGLNLTIIKHLRFKLPPLELQKSFATFVHDIDEPKYKIQQSIDQLQLLFDSLMQKYFG